MGTDYDEPNVEFCVASNPWCEFARNEAGPPLATGRSVGFIYTYSVFSTFPSRCPELWLEDFKRVLRAGGTLTLTVRPPSFIEYRRRLQTGEERGSRPSSSGLPDAESALARYDDGEFCFSPYNPAGADAVVGRSVHPRDYVERHWTKQFDLVKFEAAHGRKQHVVMLRA